jgi:murein DD-endopeptidase MepM/ murein hydrolase activator NlpD
VIVKTSLAGVMLLSGALLAIPVVIGGNGSGAAAGCGELAAILDTIRTVESGGDYTATNTRGGASGAYQYIESTWSNYDGYKSAYLAPPEVQDARAATDVQRILATFGDVAFVPIVWYWPAAVDDPDQLEIVPMPAAGNTLTVREYQQHWLAVFDTKRAAGDPSGCVSPVSADGYALPIDRALIDAHPSMLDQPHHDYPAIDLMVPEGSPVYAVRGGTVARVVQWPYNCGEVGHCEQTCGIGLSIDGDDGTRYIYCHGSRLNAVAVGETVTAGQLLMWSGNTGRSGGPHLHFEIRVDGQQRCPQSLLAVIYGSDPGGSRPCSF